MPCRLDLRTLQSSLGSSNLGVEFLHLIGFLLIYCTTQWTAPRRSAARAEGTGAAHAKGAHEGIQELLNEVGHAGLLRVGAHQDTARFVTKPFMVAFHCPAGPAGGGVLFGAGAEQPGDADMGTPPLGAAQPVQPALRLLCLNKLVQGKVQACCQRFAIQHALQCLTPGPFALCAVFRFPSLCGSVSATAAPTIARLCHSKWTSLGWYRSWQAWREAAQEDG